MLTQSSIYKEYLDLMDTEARTYYIKLKIYKLQQIFRPRIISDTSTSEKLYDREIKMYFYLAMVGFEPTPTSTAAPSNTETTVIPSRPLRSLKRSYHGRGLCLISLHTRRIALLGFVVLTQSSIYKEYLDLMDTEAWK